MVSGGPKAKSVSLTDEEWSEVIDALSALREDGLEMAGMWKGRNREGMYRQAALRVDAVLEKVKAQLVTP